GGSAAAVAAGLVAAATAADGGGSIRIPAACCGLVGMKPTRGRVSLSPAAQGWLGLTVFGSLARSVGDSALLLDVIHGPMPGDADGVAREVPDQSKLGRSSRQMAAAGRRLVPDRRRGNLIAKRDETTARLLELWQEVDVLLTPGLARTAIEAEGGYGRSAPVA